MNDKEERELINSTRRTIIGSVAGLFISACVGLTVFYFQTTYVTAQNSESIDENKKAIQIVSKKIDEIKTIPVVNQQQINAIKQDVKRIEKNTDRLADRMEKIVELLIRIDNKKD